MIDPDTIEMLASELAEGDMVDLESCPFLSRHPSAEFEFATVLSVEQDNGQFLVSYEGVDAIAPYSADTVLRITPRR